jgi:hypothetical protein
LHVIRSSHISYHILMTLEFLNSKVNVYAR